MKRSDVALCFSAVPVLLPLLAPIKASFALGVLYLILTSCLCLDSANVPREENMAVSCLPLPALEFAFTCSSYFLQLSNI